MLGEPLDRVDIGSRVDRLEGAPIDSRRLLALVPEPVAPRELSLDRDDSVGALGMAAGVVLEGGGMVKVESAQHRFRSNRAPGPGPGLRIPYCPRAG